MRPLPARPGAESVPPDDDPPRALPPARGAGAIRVPLPAAEPCSEPDPPVDPVVPEPDPPDAGSSDAPDGTDGTGTEGAGSDGAGSDGTGTEGTGGRVGSSGGVTLGTGGTGSWARAGAATKIASRARMPNPGARMSSVLKGGYH